ncbi:MAG TPA: methyltransferase domain-containing protein [Burkholderiaceae bacterium]|nr:methyltransferase domain-containing protein [Burkholderiaceae bacterium]
MSWNPEQYLKFAQPRLRPALDLLARIDLPAPARIVDLGCGTGSITGLMARRWPAAQITGVDDSAAMLERARGEHPGIRWQQQSMADWRADEPVDLLFSNAALHWLPDHPALFASLIGQLAPGGVLAVQMPRNFSAPSHTAIADTVREGPWRARLEPLLKPLPVMEPAAYFEICSPLAADVDLWETEYRQVLTGQDPVKEWTKGPWLRQFLDALDEPQRSRFETDYAARVARAYPPLPDGRTLFPFRRLFLIATR